MNLRLVNDAGIALIERFEGLSLTACKDVAGIWTIGYGHTPAAEGDVITQQQAAALLTTDISYAALYVNYATNPAATTDNQFAAMVSLAYNIGPARSPARLY